MGQKFTFLTVSPPGRIQPQPAHAVLFDDDEAWISYTQLARAEGYVEHWEVLTSIPLGKKQIGEIPDVRCLRDPREGAGGGAPYGHSRREAHIQRDVVSLCMGWRFPDVNSLGDWTMLPLPAEPEAGPSGQQSRGEGLAAKAANLGPAKEAKAPGSKRGSSSASGHYNVKYTETEQLMFRARGMEGLRVACRSLVAEGHEIKGPSLQYGPDGPGRTFTPATSWDEVIPPPDRAPSELRPYYGKVGAQCFPGAPACTEGPFGADLPRQAWRNVLPPWVAVAVVDGSPVREAQRGIGEGTVSTDRGQCR
jgi:hypothetical protein